MRTRAHALILAAILAAGLLIGLQVGRGALDEGALDLPDPCARTVALPGDGVDARAQRIALRALDHAACELGTTREALLEDVLVVLRDDGSLPDGVQDRLNDGLQRGIDAEEERGLNAVAAFTLRQTVRFTPFDWLLGALRELEPLVD